MSQQIKPINKSLRRIIFWLFVIAFFIISPLIILYTSGYRYNPHSGRLVKTGVLTIDSDPRGATIKLNNELQEKKTPTTIKQLLPGTYELTVEKENYKAWRGKIQIYGGQTTNISNIFLFLDSEPDVLFTKTASSVKPSPTGDTVAYLTNTQGWEEIWLFQPKKNSHTMIGQDIAAGETQLNWSANGHYLSTLNSTRGLMIFNKNGSKLDIDYITTTPLEIFWHPSDDNILYLS
ncbi:PEGA domain-containing protein, partial [Candidatus Parcubacteria bacterium]